MLQEVEAARGNVILFIDELHILLGLEQAEGSIDASNLLKPEVCGYGSYSWGSLGLMFLSLQKACSVWELPQSMNSRAL